MELEIERTDGVAPILLREWLLAAEPARPSGASAPERSSHELGWLLGLIAHGLGVDVLGDRRERSGLRPLLALLDDALARAGKPRTCGPVDLPEVGTAAQSGPAAAWLVAELLWTAASGRGEALVWGFERGAQVICLTARGGATATEAALLRERALSVPLVWLDFEPQGWRVSFPAGMLAQA